MAREPSLFNYGKIGKFYTAQFARTAKFTRMNGNGSCLSNTRLQN